ncbi:hypothetical protein [Beijerinckia indica]|uniref:Uncharacterized protein n=1 Tax=Beijerinckia indica subsp. indica (strain ATCC 9039 / DSM 1715 / NCIMB 8712) TaxID=395963 RepID=B2IB26_BEII9|nr:hypothetical protein [Beijerinckia indica]ACB93726.1 conserved hypothetical protein [Beijerinckia indica subsp. indica ATCC 9039]
MKSNPWLRASFSALTLSVEASSVIALRMMKLVAGGKAAEREARRMVNEKIKANLNLGVKAMTGKLGSTPQSVIEKTSKHYNRKVRANKRRLSSGQ